MVASQKNHTPLASYNIAIVGLGPKGLYALERLLAQLKSKGITTPITLHLFNQNPFLGAGNVYRDDQPQYLIMNYANKNINIWSNELPNAIADNMQPFINWLAQQTGETVDAVANKFAPRAMVGTYLKDAFLRLRGNVPENIHINVHTTTVTNIIKTKEKFTIETAKNLTIETPSFDSVILTTGHLGTGAQFDIACKTKRCIDFIYPTVSKLSSISKTDSVAIKGFGLTCIDAILALTQGRQGAFQLNEKETYSYKSSGKEPKSIYPFSRTGLPMFPRSGVADDMCPLFFFTSQNIKTETTQEAISFEETLLPLIKKECYFRYYRVLFSNNKRKLKYNAVFKNIIAQVEKFHNDFPFLKTFDWDDIINPFEQQGTITHNDMLTYIEYLILEAEKGPEKSPIMAAVGTWRKISPVFNEVYSFGGLDATSHKLFDEHYFGLFNRIAYGPPITNMKKLVALANAGIIDFSATRSPKIVALKETGKYELRFSNTETRATAFSENPIVINTLINARIPKGASTENNTLYSNLIKSGLLQNFKNTKQGNYISGGIAIDYKGRAIALDGSTQKGLTLYGTPTEGVTFDNDTLSRKRNNFASQWALDTTLSIKEKTTEEKYFDEAHTLH